MSEPHACLDCLRRAQLIAHLAPHIERATAETPTKTVFELLRLSGDDLARAVAPKIAAGLLADVQATPEARLRNGLATAKCWACCYHDRLYPPGLRLSVDAPWVLFGRGDPKLLSRLRPDAVVTMVGSRRASSYGRGVARELAREVCAAGAVVSSGLAFGIDACAHRGALEAGLTVAVLGCGPDIAYPASHRSLWRRVSEAGLVVSELPPGTGAWRWTFPARNRILAGIAGVTVVVEAAQRSGSMITAERALDLGRVVGAVPGPVTSRCSAGPNQLLAGGARLVRDGRDVFADLSGAACASEVGG
jgi:DNA processing protein